MLEPWYFLLPVEKDDTVVAATKQKRLRNAIIRYQHLCKKYTRHYQKATILIETCVTLERLHGRGHAAIDPLYQHFA
jgi:hypothetical protein